MGKQIELHFETLAMANYAITKRLLAFIATKQLLSDSELQAIFSACAEDITRSTLPIGPEQAEQALTLFWSGFSAGKPNPDLQ